MGNMVIVAELWRLLPSRQFLAPVVLFLTMHLYTRVSCAELLSLRRIWGQGI